MTIRHTEAAAQVEVQRTRLVLHVRAAVDAGGALQFLSAGYRDQIRQRVAALLPGLQRRMGVTANNVFVQRMKTKWGGCNAQRQHPVKHRACQKAPDCLGTSSFTSLLTLIVPRHNEQFVDLMDRFYPNWRVAGRAQCVAVAA